MIVGVPSRDSKQTSADYEAEALPPDPSCCLTPSFILHGKQQLNCSSGVLSFSVLYTRLEKKIYRLKLRLKANLTFQIQTNPNFTCHRICAPQTPAELQFLHVNTNE
jgi:hypothetical protein